MKLETATYQILITTFYQSMMNAIGTLSTCVASFNNREEADTAFQKLSAPSTPADIKRTAIKLYDEQ